MVAITYRTLGPWGSGKGANLQPSEVDSNFWNIAEAIVALETNPAQPVGIASITVSGTQMYIALTDGTTLGPYTLPVLTFRWRGEWDAGASYVALDVVTIANTGIFMCQVSHTAGATFDINQELDGTLVWLQLFGSTDASLSGLSDVEISDLSGGEFLRWDMAAAKWVNVALGSIAYQDSDAVDITGGRITGMPTPTVPSEVVTKGYVDALPGGATAPSGTMLANITLASAPAIPNTLSDYLDFVLGTTATGSMLHRGAAGWDALDPGIAGNFLQTHGPGFEPTWEVGASGVIMVMPGTGISTGAGSITSSGTVSLADIADKNFLSNISGATAAPTPHTLSAFLDAVLTTARGSVLTRTSGGWQALLPGTSGLYLKSTGTGADLVWDAPAGSGTVTSVNAGTGITTGGSPITSTGSVSLAAVANQTLLANISGGSAAPSASTLTTILDAILGSTRGNLLYRSGTGWQALAAGTAGQILSTGGTSANPSWINAPSGGPISNLQILANLSGSTATATGQTVSAVLDAVFSSTRGSLLYRGASGWAALSPGTTGQLLQTGGAAGDPSWTTPASGGTTITISDTAPASPTAGALWWSSADGNLYLYYNDGTSSQWVSATNQPNTGGGTGGLSGMTAGQIPVATTATTITSSIPLPFTAIQGGTGQSTYAQGDLLYASAANTLSRLAKDTNATRYLSNTGTSNAPAWAQINLANGVTGTLPIGSGGTNATALPLSAGVGNYGLTSTLLGSSGAAVAPIAGAAGTVGTWGGGQLALQHFGEAGIELSRVNGTLASPTAIVSGDFLGTIWFNGWTSNTWPAGEAPARISAIASENWTTTARGTQLKFSTTANGVLSGTVTMTLDGSGNLTIAGATAVKPGGGSWVAPSERSLKTSVTGWSTGLQAVLALTPISYKYLNETWNIEKFYVGLDADDAGAIIPEMTREINMVPHAEDHDGEPDAITVSALEFQPLLMALINAVKELNARIEALEVAR